MVQREPAYPYLARVVNYVKCVSGDDIIARSWLRLVIGRRECLTYLIVFQHYTLVAERFVDFFLFQPIFRVACVV